MRCSGRTQVTASPSYIFITITITDIVAIIMMSIITIVSYRHVSCHRQRHPWFLDALALHVAFQNFSPGLAVLHHSSRAFILRSTMQISGGHKGKGCLLGRCPAGAQGLLRRPFSVELIKFGPWRRGKNPVLHEDIIGFRTRFGIRCSQKPHM